MIGLHLGTGYAYAFWTLLPFLMWSCEGISITINSQQIETGTLGTSIEVTTPKAFTNETSSQNSNNTVPERQKRLLPYITYYITQNRTFSKPVNQNSKRYRFYVPGKIVAASNPPKSYGEYPKQNKYSYTPFLEHNAIPGPFVPIVHESQKNINIPFTRTKSYEPTTDFGEIYDKLLELKSQQTHQITKAPNFKRPLAYYVRNESPEYRHRHQFPVTKTVVQTYTPTNIDVSPEQGYLNENTQHISISPYTDEYTNTHKIKPYVTKQFVVEIPSGAYTEKPKIRTQNYLKPILILHRPSSRYPTEIVKKPLREQVVYLHTKPTQSDRHYSTPIVEENYVAQKYINSPKTTYTVKVQQASPQKYIPNYYTYDNKYEPATPTPIEATTHQIFREQNFVPEEDPNSLSVMLKNLQDANALPHTLTVNNIDNSIKTLMKILNSLKKHRTSFKPIIVADENEESSSGEKLSTVKLPTQHATSPESISSEYVIPETIVENYPEDTREGGTPGTPGVDYPALSTIPPTSFNCKTQRYKGFFGDPDTNCQVWHYCDLNGGQASFLCPNGTIFSQVALTCDWWYNVKCSSTAQLYVLNERLYKYILPFAPKFPEDYSGPLVDKYLALKFMEMEEKMKKEKKGKEQNNDESTTLEDDLVEATTIENDVKTI